MRIIDLQQILAPGLNNKSLTNLRNEYGDWIIWGFDDLLCTSCSQYQLLIKKSGSSNFPVDFATVCTSFQHFQSVLDVPMEHKFVMSDRVKLIEENSNFDSTSAKVSEIFQIIKTSKVSSSELETELQLSKLAAAKLDAPVPDGYRNIAWIRKYEAEAILQTYKNEKSVALHDDNGRVFFESTFFTLESSEAKKFRANACAVRHRASGTRLVGWIRREEARAVLDAIEKQKSIEFSHIKFGSGGMVQYFPEDSPQAKKYLSTTRLLRKM